jgi:GntR family transcriptional regulator
MVSCNENITCDPGLLKGSPNKMAVDTRIRRDVPIPYYYQLIRLLEDDIEAGKWSTGDLVPSEHELCAIYGVSRTVVRQALGTLVARGLLLRVKGKGTFIAPRKLEEKFVQRSDGFFREMAGRGLTVTSQVLDQRVIAPAPHIRQAMGLEDGSSVIKIDRLRSVESQVLLFVQTYIPYDLCPGLLGADLSTGSLYALLREEYGLSVDSGKRWLEAVTAHPPLTTVLEVPRGAPLLKIESVSYLADGRALEFYEAWHRADRSRFEIEMVVETATVLANGRPLAAEDA